MLRRKVQPPPTLPLPSVVESTDGGGIKEGATHTETEIEAAKIKIMQESKDYEITDNGNTNMKVVVRVRPENEMEIRGNCQTVVKVLDEHVLVFDPKEDNMPQFEKAESSRKRRPFLTRKHRDLRFAFDRVFDETSTQHEVFENTTKTIIDGLLDGINCSVFAYGATGAGKTYTMLGCQESPGIMFLTTMELYRRIDQLKHDKTCEVAVTYLEVYNETIRDLLVPSGPLAMREDGQKGLVVSGLSQHQPTSAEDLLRMLEDGNKNRTQHPTDANATSSRSHAVFQVYVNQKSRTAGLSAEITQGKMSLIDLAGSERGTVSTNRGARLREGANINKSLLALGNCINALAANKEKTGHVPYRNSKLTRLLKDSLGGNCRTVMIANISPSGLTYEDTYNTLKYADRAKQIKTKLVRNIVNVDYHVTRYKTIVIELQKEITELKSRLDTRSTTPTFNTFDSSETNRLQCMIQGVYNERGSLRKSMADLDAAERDTLLRIFRKERDLQRVEVLTGNDTKILKLENKLEYLRGRLREIKEQKTVVHQQLSRNNEGIGRVQSEISKALSASSDSSEVITDQMEMTSEVRKLESECAHQWKQTKHLLRYIKNQEKEISRTEKVFVLALELVRKQYQLLQATNCLTPVVRDLFDTLVKHIDGEKEVNWATNQELQDSLCNISVSTFSSSHQVLFDSIVSNSSPLRKLDTARYSSPTNSASLGILSTSKVPTTTDPVKPVALTIQSPSPSPSSQNKGLTSHPLSNRLVAPPTPVRLPSTDSMLSSISTTSLSTSTGGSLAGKVLNVPMKSPSRKKRVVFSPPPPTVEEIEDEDVWKSFEKKPTAPISCQISQTKTQSVDKIPPPLQVKEKKNTTKKIQIPTITTTSSLSENVSNSIPPPPQRSQSTSSVLTQSTTEKTSLKSSSIVVQGKKGSSPKSRVNLAQLTSITKTADSSVVPVTFQSPVNAFEDNFVASYPAPSKSINRTPVSKSTSNPPYILPPPSTFIVTPSNKRLPMPSTTPVLQSYPMGYHTPNGRRVPIPTATPISSQPYQQGSSYQFPYQYPPPPNNSFVTQPFASFSPVFEQHFIPPPRLGGVMSPTQSQLNRCVTSLSYNTADSPPPHLTQPKIQDKTAQSPSPNNMIDITESSLSNPLYMVQPSTIPSSTHKHKPVSQTGSTKPPSPVRGCTSPTTSEDKLNLTYVKSQPSVLKENPPQTGSSKSAMNTSSVTSIFKGKDKRSKKSPPLLNGTKPLQHLQVDSTGVLDTNRSITQTAGEKKQPSYLALTKSAAFKRVQLGQPTRNGTQKENHPFSTRSHSFRSKHKIQQSVPISSRSYSSSSVS